MNKLLQISAASLLAFSVYGVQASTLSDVQAKGSLSCGVSKGLAGFSAADSSGTWTGVDVDVCRAVAAATLGDASKVKFVPLTAKERFTALQSGEIDILSRNTTWTITRDASLGLNFAGVNYYDGQGFMVKSSLGISSANDLGGAAVCIQAGTTTELNLADWGKANGIDYTSVVSDTNAQTLSNYDAGRCDVLTTDASGLYSMRAASKDPSEHVVLPEIISKEPLGPVVRQGDDAWFNIVRWSLNAMITAEEVGVTSATVDEVTNNPERERLMGRSGNTHEYVGLNSDWTYQIIKQVGNYAESFERNIGLNTPIGIARGVNALWTQGGILYSPPFR
jgi:general L-amino acid transport system substrate-binding protein|tara:strand:- start:1090 stop:2097 length:1008 start_codon:yes stop_codon:yes gene_type:complete